MKRFKALKRHKRAVCAVGGLAAGFLNGLFGSGGGTLIVPFLEEFLEQDEHTAHATAILIISGFTVVSLLFYAFGHALDWPLAFCVSLGGMAGGFLGARLLRRLSGAALRRVFGAFLLFAAVRMVFAA